MNAHQRRVVKRSNKRNGIKELWDKFNEDKNNIESIYNLIQKDHQVNGRFTLCDYVNNEVKEKVDMIIEKNPIYFEENKEEILESARALDFWTEKEKEIKDLEPMLDCDEMGLPYKKDGMFTKLKKYFKGE